MPVCCLDLEFEKPFKTKRAATLLQFSRASELFLLHRDMTYMTYHMICGTLKPLSSQWIYEISLISEESQWLKDLWNRYAFSLE